MEPQSLIQFFIDRGPTWVTFQRQVHRANGRTLSGREVEIMAPFFGQNVTNGVRIVSVPIIQNPDFYEELKAQGVPTPLDFTVMSGITFQDTILMSHSHPVDRDSWSHLLFHELVHLVQYALLGVGEFVRQYVLGWASNGFSYEAIPLERHAYELDQRFASNPSGHFQVRLGVARWLGVA